ncbi:phage integrase N-terminal SAM-like domain-containing protein [Streptococcus parasanguinis]|uniref:phage integrase N-terminal SAM-like domain-containing protein n=1 Tax=Streptococcus parasanguinis TaxID=1318 RepID=UPI001E62A5BD|nr:phage integrase N-terminal SAM-like domain-containing protein [Streptococcus parasanguinis]
MGSIKSIPSLLKRVGGSLTIICNYFRKECIMPRKRNSLKHDLFIAASKNITNNRTRTSYKRAITRFTKWAKEHNIKKKSDITEEVIQLYQLDLNDDPKQYSVATIHTYLAPICKAVDINMNID